MSGLNTVLLIVSPLLVLHYGYGTELLDQPSYYYMLFEKIGVERDNPIGFSIFTDGQPISEENTRHLKVHCRRANGFTSMDLITITGTEEEITTLDTDEEQTILDTFFVENCDFDGIVSSIYLQKPSSGVESFIFVDTEGNCHRRTYESKNWKYGSVVKRSKAESKPCPEEIKREIQKTHATKGIVKSWSPDGLALMPSIDKPEEEIIKEQTLDFLGAPGYSIVCRVVGTKDADSKGNDAVNKHIAITLKYADVDLDRFDLMGKSCSVNYYVTPTGDGKDRDKLRLTITSGAENRDYTLSLEPQGAYKKVTLEKV